MMPLQDIFDHCGLLITRHETVHGGDINQCFCLYSSDNKYFLKVNDAARYPRMFEKEADGLKALKEHSKMIIPSVIKQGVAGGHQYLLLEWIEKGGPGQDFWKNFGASLANMHRQAHSSFGWPADNYIGSLVQCNTPHSFWHTFYAECRILPLVKILSDRGSFAERDVKAAESVCKKVDVLFPDEPPALLHGDLWAGNYMVTASGYAAIYDPAVYYGHREIDIGMTKLFGGFDQPFYDAYNEEYPLEKDWQKRLPLTQLYPILVHAVLFGAHYAGKAREIIRQYGNL